MKQISEDKLAELECGHHSRFRKEALSQYPDCHCADYRKVLEEIREKTNEHWIHFIADEALKQEERI